MAKKAHGDKYDYSKVQWVNTSIKVCIVCPKHGEFFQRPDRHLQGQGCPVCRYIKSAKNNRKEVCVVTKANIMKLSDGLFLESARNISEKHKNIKFREC